MHKASEERCVAHAVALALSRRMIVIGALRTTKALKASWNNLSSNVVSNWECAIAIDELAGMDR
jgi:hypothetical protein